MLIIIFKFSRRNKFANIGGAGACTSSLSLFPFLFLPLSPCLILSCFDSCNFQTSLVPPPVAASASSLDRIGSDRRWDRTQAAAGTGQWPSAFIVVVVVISAVWARQEFVCLLLLLLPAATLAATLTALLLLLFFGKAFCIQLHNFCCDCTHTHSHVCMCVNII